MKLSCFGTATLGGLLDKLRRLPPDAQVFFDFCNCAPSTLNSYRGYYDHLAFAWGDEPVTVKEVVARLGDARGETFRGYKGGSYRMDDDSPVWVDGYSKASSTAIVGVIDEEWRVILETRYVQ